MPTQCNQDSFAFASVEGRRVEAAFDGGAVTSEAGALLLGATDRAVRLVDRFAACFHDARRPELIEHQVRTLVGQRIVAMALGYAIGRSLDPRHAVAALERAVALRRPLPGCVVHTDRGSQGLGKEQGAPDRSRSRRLHEPPRQPIRQLESGELHEDPEGGGRLPRRV